MDRRSSGPNLAQRLKRPSDSRLSGEAARRSLNAAQDQTLLQPAPQPAQPAQLRPSLGRVASVNPARRFSAERVAKSIQRSHRARSVPSSATPAPHRNSMPPAPPRAATVPIAAGSLIEISGYAMSVGKQIGKGGYSHVYQATIQATKQLCALKVVRLKEGSEEETKNLIGEVELLKALKEVDHVVQLIACDISPHEARILLELGQCDLRQVLAQRSQKSQSLSLDFVRYWGGEMLKCIAAVHAHNIIHADLKPANFLVVGTGLKLIDFGIANAVPDYTTSVHRHTQVGTVMYMAPETLWRADGGPDYKVTKASDLWSGGLILYEMVYQRSPFSFDQSGILLLQIMQQPINHPKLAPGNIPVPIALHEVINACLDRDPNKRPSAKQAIDSLFFSPVSIDWQGLNSVMQSSYRFGRRQSTASQSGRASDAELNKSVKEAVEDAWKKLIAINRGKWDD